GAAELPSWPAALVSTAPCAVSAAGKTGVGLSFEREGRIELAWASHDGQHVSTVLGSRSTGYIEPAWSADGQCLAFTMLSGEEDLPPDYSVGVVRGEQKVPVGGTGDELPSWDPSGRRIVDDDRFGAGLFIESLDSSGETQPTDWGTSPVWSPDG